MINTNFQPIIHVAKHFVTYTSIQESNFVEDKGDTRSHRLTSHAASRFEKLTPTVSPREEIHVHYLWRSPLVIQIANEQRLFMGMLFFDR